MFVHKQTPWKPKPSKLLWNFALTFELLSGPLSGGWVSEIPSFTQSGPIVKLPGDKHTTIQWTRICLSRMCLPGPHQLSPACLNPKWWFLAVGWIGLLGSESFLSCNNNGAGWQVNYQRWIRSPARNHQFKASAQIRWTNWIKWFHKC